MKITRLLLALMLTLTCVSLSFINTAGAQTGTVNYSAVPDTTVVNGKPVKLKSFPDGLKYIDLTIGTGAVAKSGQTITVKYYGTTIDKKEFDGTDLPGRTPFVFPVGAGKVIPGWDEGILGSSGISGMKVGGKRRLVIPAKLGYGDSSPTNAIPPGSTLIFDVKLLAVK